MKKIKEWLTTTELAEYLQVSLRTLQNYRDRGVLSYSKISKKKILYRITDVNEFLESNNFKKY